MVANLEWVNTAPDSENNYTMACPFPLEGESTSTGLPSAPDSENNYTMTCPYPIDGESTGSGPISSPNIPLAVLICRENSHPFQKRTLLLHNPVKVGRSVAKTKADVNNAIFDCKVLSRYHASLWYENGRFYLADTKSSNGTFVNSYRLSEGSKESGPYEVSSGDIVQFGVDVMENSGSVTHGCIVATLKLFLPNGKEAKAIPNPMPIDELHILHKIIQEATEREFILEEKLNSLHQSIDNCRKAAEVSWHAQVYEDHLLCRVLFLEKRLAAVSGTSPQTEMQQLLEDKHNYEVSAKESLRQAQEERLKLMNQVCSLQWSLCSSEDECATFRKSTERANEEYQKLSSSHASLEQQLKTTQKSLTNAENRLSEEKRRIKELITDHEKEVIQIKSENEKHSMIETGISDLIDSQKNSIIIDNKSSDMIDYKESSLPEAIRSLPDYIKAILPDQVLQKVGCKSLRTSTQVNELQLKLYTLKNELEKCQLESDHTDDKVNDNTEHIVSEPETKEEISTSEDTNKQLPVDDNDIDNGDDSKSPPSKIENESENGDIINEDEKEILNRKNETYENSNFIEKSGKETINEAKLSLLDEIKKLTEQIEQIEVKEEGPVEKMIFLQEELSSAQNIISNLKIEQKKLNATLLDSYMNSSDLVRDIDHLTFERAELVNEIEQKTELCRTLSLKLSQLKEKEKLGDASNAKYKEVALELKNQLSRAIESEANSCKETKELNAKIAELQKQVDSRPQVSEVVTLKSQIDKLQSQLDSKEKEITELHKKITILTEIEVALEEKICKLSAKQESLEAECENITVNGTESCHNGTSDLTVEEPKENIVISSTIGAANLMWDHDNGQFLTNEGSSSTSISINFKRLSELEEELVITKEKWAHVNEDRSLLASELQIMTEKYKNLANRSIFNSLVYIVPIAGLLLYMLMYQMIS